MLSQSGYEANLILRLGIGTFTCASMLCSTKLDRVRLILGLVQIMVLPICTNSPKGVATMYIHARRHASAIQCSFFKSKALPSELGIRSSHSLRRVQRLCVRINPITRMFVLRI